MSQSHNHNNNNTSTLVYHHDNKLYDLFLNLNSGHLNQEVYEQVGAHNMVSFIPKNARTSSRNSILHNQNRKTFFLKPAQSLWFYYRSLSSYPLFNLYLTAQCSSHGGQRESVNYDFNDEGIKKGETGGLPGFQRKQNVSAETKIVGEFQINRFIEAESGWDRVKHMYRTSSGKFQDDYTQAMNTLLYRTAVISFFMNAMVAGVKLDKPKKNLSKTEALRAGVMSQAMVPKKVLMSALKDTFKLSILSFSLLHVANTISAYRNKTSVWEFTFSSALGFGTLGVFQGLHKIGYYTLGGAVFGLVGGYIACKALESTGQTQELRTMKRMQQSIEEQRLAMENDSSDLVTSI